jgi:hypothetical protein
MATSWNDEREQDKLSRAGGALYLSVCQAMSSLRELQKDIWLMHFLDPELTTFDQLLNEPSYGFKENYYMLSIYGMNCLANHAHGRVYIRD